MCIRDRSRRTRGCSRSVWTSRTRSTGTSGRCCRFCARIRGPIGWCGALAPSIGASGAWASTAGRP
eukprot:9097559-Lingulodinium_polyedra.AAC.1